MNGALVILCLAIASSTALPTRVAKAPVIDLLKDLEDIVHEDGKVLMEKMITVAHHIESGLQHVKDVVPKVHEKIHQDADEVLEGLKRVVKKIEEFLESKRIFYGFDLLGSLTELSGGTKLSTVLDLLSLADKAHKVVKDAQEFTPNLEKTLEKIQGHIEDHVKEFASHVLKELGLQDVSHSASQIIEDLFNRAKTEYHKLILSLLHSMEAVLDLIESEFPTVYEKVQGSINEVREKIHELIKDVEKSLIMRSFSLLDLAGNVSDGTSLGTAIKVMSLVDKFNTVVQDVRNFEPRAEQFLDHSVKKVADSAQDFFTHAAQKLME